MADIIIDILGAERSGLYATFSIMHPRTTVNTITTGMAICIGRSAARYTITRPAIINMSPWAKLISRKRLPEGWHVGYGRHTVLHHATQVGILQAGAMAGCFIHRQESKLNPLRYFYRGVRSVFHPKKLLVEIAGRQVPILGAIGMNHLAIDLDHCSANIGDFALFAVNPAFCPPSLPRLFCSKLPQEDLS